MRYRFTCWWFFKFIISKYILSGGDTHAANKTSRNGILHGGILILAKFKWNNLPKDFWFGFYGCGLTNGEWNCGFWVRSCNIFVLLVKKMVVFYLQYYEAGWIALTKWVKEIRQYINVYIYKEGGIYFIYYRYRVATKNTDTIKIINLFKVIYVGFRYINSTTNTISNESEKIKTLFWSSFQEDLFFARLII